MLLCALQSERMDATKFARQALGRNARVARNTMSRNRKGYWLTDRIYVGGVPRTPLWLKLRDFVVRLYFRFFPPKPYNGEPLDTSWLE